MSERIGTVVGLNEDGTVSVDFAGFITEAIPAAPGYVGRKPGDRVLVQFGKGRAYVLGLIGAAAASVTDATGWIHTTATSTPGVGFGIVSSIYVNPVTKEIRYIWSTPPAASSGTVTVAASFATYLHKTGRFVTDDYAEQGVWAKKGPYMGLFLYGPGAFSALSGHVVTKVTLTLRRAKYGSLTKRPIYLGTHDFTVAPSTCTGADLADINPRLTMVRGETTSIILPNALGTALRDGSISGFGIHDANVADDPIPKTGGFDARINKATLTIDWS